MWSGKAFTMFLDECRNAAEQLSLLPSELSEPQRAELVQLVHRLRGSAGFFGQKELQNECKSLEQELKAGKQVSELSAVVQNIRVLALHCAQQPHSA